nr:hypothetical protein [Micromonospora sp. DSM 115978]
MSDRMSRRAVMAALLLLASPERLQDHGDGSAKLSVTFDSIAELRAWLDDADLNTPDLLIVDRTLTDDNGRSYRSATAFPTWHGWEIFAYAREDIDPSPLDESTRDGLTALVSAGSAVA